MNPSIWSRPPRLAVALLTALVALGFGLALAARAGAEAYLPSEVIVGYAPQTDLRADARILGANPVPADAQPRSTLLRLPRGESVSRAITILRRQPGVLYAEPDYIVHLAGREPRAEVPLAGAAWQQMQWNLQASTGVNAPQAWTNLIADHRAGGRGIVVAVLDTGVAYRNWKGFRAAPEFAATRFVDPYDFVDHNRYPLDRNGHGTFVAGLIAQSVDNHLGAAGLAYGVSIMPLRVLDASGEGDESTIARAIRYAVDHGAQVINLSLEFLPSQVASAADIPQIESAIHDAIRRGVTVVAAAGNDGSDQIAYPARTPGVISVGATTRDRCLADYSNGGSSLDLVAPGGGDDAILPGDPDCHPERNLPAIRQLTLIDPPHWARFGYPGDYMGTSMATPEVSATVALVIASGVVGSHPSPAAILARLEQTATPLGGSQPNAYYGYGLVNAGAATATAPPGQTATSAGSVAGSGSSIASPSAGAGQTTSTTTTTTPTAG
jgi:serine protease